MPSKNQFDLRLPISLGVFALLGPFVRWLTWPPAKFESWTTLSLAEFVYDLVFLLWPTQSLAVVEATTGRVVAVVFTVGTNVILFALIGAAASAIRQVPILLRYLAVCGLVLLLAVWGAGFDLSGISLSAVGVALLLYAVPFWAAGSPSETNQ